MKRKFFNKQINYILLLLIIFVLFPIAANSFTLFTLEQSNFLEQFEHRISKRAESCPNGKFRCNDGSCLNKIDLCNGKIDCNDGADERSALCKDNTCPSFSFRCRYGGCIDKNLKCDGVSHCKDGSDENINLCEDNLCDSDQFQCKNGVCIKEDKVCNGFINCRDGSDETAELCKNRRCGRKQFRCKYGACISDKRICNGFADCKDKSDETTELCRSTTCQQDQFQCDYGACVYDFNTCNGISDCVDGSDENKKTCGSRSNRNSSAVSCTLPSNTPDKKFNVRSCYQESQLCKLQPGDKLPELYVLTVTCNRGYEFEDHDYFQTVCLDGNWWPEIINCKKICKQLQPKTVDFVCYKSREGLKIDCNRTLLEGSVISITCKPQHYKESAIDYSDITCQPNGEWSNAPFKCFPKCGISLADATTLIAYGNKTKYGDSPWHVAIYQKQGNITRLICGGTIITPLLVITAAHCVYDDSRHTIPSNLRDYEIAVSKISTDFKIQDNGDTRFYKIQEVMFSPVGYTGLSTNYAGDIAILRLSEKVTLSSVVLPACIDLDQSGNFNPGKNKTGKLVGSGLNEKGEPSEFLQTADLPFISRADCLNQVSEDFKSSIGLDKFCAGSSSSKGVGARQGDSGGGLMFRDSQSNLYYLRGIVSIRETWTQSSIALFTDVTAYTKWIADVINKLKYEED